MLRLYLKISQQIYFYFTYLILFANNKGGINYDLYHKKARLVKEAGLMMIYVNGIDYIDSVSTTFASKSA